MGQPSGGGVIKVRADSVPEGRGTGAVGQGQIQGLGLLDVEEEVKEVKSESQVSALSD